MTVTVAGVATSYRFNGFGQRVANPGGSGTTTFYVFGREGHLVMRHSLNAFALITLQLVFIPAAGADGLKKPGAAEEVTVPTGVIFSEKVSQLNGLCTGSSNCWLPAAADVAALEKHLPSYLLAAEEPSAKQIWKNLPSYRRKYFGYIKDGDHWIVMIGLCPKFWHPRSKGFRSLRPPGTDLEECYFSASYNVDIEKFEDITSTGRLLD